MIAHQITAIRKPDRNSTHEHITDVKYDGISNKVASVIRLIEARTDSFFVHAGGATTPVVVVYRGLGHAPYLKTKPDWTGKDNLLSLPEF